MEKYICIHAHFYQPPRENPWLETIEYQQSAHPYHDWNQKINAECYRPNGKARILDSCGRIDRIINNYSAISFNFGPTLLSWLAAEDSATYRRIIEADRDSRKRFSGHGSAIAQAYNHAILPLCNYRDKITQIRWGISDFSFRFGRLPESMWLPETAADLETLDLMAQMGLRYVILAPHQAKRVRQRGERTWRNINNQDIDPSMVYELRLPTGRRIAVFFYDGPISLSVGFEKLLSDGEAFVHRLMGAFSPEREWAQIVHIATDGETYGHHHAFGDMALAYALNAIDVSEEARLINYGEYLEKYPPTHLVEIRENSSWSCSHGLERWRGNCGCSTGAHPGWQQQWRAPLREAMDWLRDNLENLYDDDAITYIKDPWAARNDYIEVILDRSSGSVERFLAKHQNRDLTAEERARVLKLLELQRHALLMYTSCGWFFDDISGIETIQILQYAGRAIQLGEELFGKDNIESGFLEILQKAVSNNPDTGNGSDLYRKFVKPAMIDRYRAAGHYAVSSLFQSYPEQADLYSYTVNRDFSRILTSGRSRLAVGCCGITSKITGESSEVEYAVVHIGDHKIRGGVKECSNPHAAQEIFAEITRSFEKEDLSAVSRMIEEYFGQTVFSLGSLFKDEQRRILNTLVEAAKTDLEELNRQAFERTAPLMKYLVKLGLVPPPSFHNVAEAVVNSQFMRAFQANELNAKKIDELFEVASFWHVELDKEGLEYALREKIENLAQKSYDNPGDLPSLRNFAAAVRLAPKLPFTINFYRTQNICYDILQNNYRHLRMAAAKGDKSVGIWIEEFRELAGLLSIKVDGPAD